eukprot:TRINITY_DN17825_c0_g1_i1.p1 TRINITY_DN17825_c0_g1~~TRINITY_DN17825_c0_g1_i1.p1  ORF type:complete len:442 (+),score=120.90 TRINITY_DN17825_c0_g1_i1:64-1326(+)
MASFRPPMGNLKNDRRIRSSTPLGEITHLFDNKAQGQGKPSDRARKPLAGARGYPQSARGPSRSAALIGGLADLPPARQPPLPYPETGPTTGAAAAAVGFGGGGAATGGLQVYCDNVHGDSYAGFAQEVALPQPPQRTPRQSLRTSDAQPMQDDRAARSSDPQKVAEYVTDIFEGLRNKEAGSAVNPNYMDRQTDINTKMRAILVDWLVEVHLKYKMRSEVLFLTVNIIDRFLAVRVVSRKQLQLVGVAAMLIASKFEEIYPPEVKELAYITDNAYKVPEIMRMEVKILNALAFRVCEPTMHHFLDAYVEQNQCDDLQKHLIYYLTELALPEQAALKYTPSTLVAAACFLSNKMLQKTPAWSPEMVATTGRTEHELTLCARELCAFLDEAAAGGSQQKLQAVWRKFSQQTYSAVALLKVV